MAKDVCEALDLGNTAMALSEHCEPHQVRLVARSNLTGSAISFPNRGANCVNEGGLFALILGSKKPEAKKFKAWVCDVVLPAIRKDGAYVMGEEKVVTGEMSEDELVLKAVGILQRKVERLAEVSSP